MCTLQCSPPGLVYILFCFFIENALCICASLYWSIFCIFIENALCICAPLNWSIFFVFLLRMPCASLPPWIGLYFVFLLRIHCAFCRTIGPCSTHCTSLTNFSPLSCHSDDQKSWTCKNPFYFRIYCLQQSRHKHL